MGQQYYQLDTNTIIDYLNGKLPTKANELLDNIIAEISVITRMELLLVGHLLINRNYKYLKALLQMPSYIL